MLQNPQVVSKSLHRQHNIVEHIDIFHLVSLSERMADFIDIPYFKKNIKVS